MNLKHHFKHVSSSPKHLYFIWWGEGVGRISNTCGVQTRTHMNYLIATMYFNWSYLAIATATIFLVSRKKVNPLSSVLYL